MKLKWVIYSDIKGNSYDFPLNSVEYASSTSIS